MQEDRTHLLNAVYVDVRDTRAVVSIRPKPPSSSARGDQLPGRTSRQLTRRIPFKPASAPSAPKGQGTACPQRSPNVVVQQTFANGRSYYREHRGSRGVGGCTDIERSIPCHVADDQVATIIESMVLPDEWLEAALQRISLRDEVARVTAERERVTEKLKRLGRAFVDGLVDQPDYDKHKAQLAFGLTSLVVPEADAVAEAGRLVRRLPELWRAADLSERRRLLLTLLDAVYIDARAAGTRTTPSGLAVILLSRLLR